MGELYGSSGTRQRRSSSCSDVAPALVIGLPVGFVGAAESKEALLASGLPAVANRGPKGGSAVAAAALNALIYLEEG